MIFYILRQLFGIQRQSFNICSLDPTLFHYIFIMKPQDKIVCFLYSLVVAHQTADKASWVHVVTSNKYVNVA